MSRRGLHKWCKRQYHTLFNMLVMWDMFKSWIDLHKLVKKCGTGSWTVGSTKKNADKKGLWLADWLVMADLIEHGSFRNGAKICYRQTRSVESSTAIWAASMRESLLASYSAGSLSVVTNPGRRQRSLVGLRRRRYTRWWQRSWLSLWGPSVLYTILL